jgi:hypothetical protein
MSKLAYTPSTIRTGARAALAALGAAFLAFTAVPDAKAQGNNARINLVVMSDDADPDTVPRNNRIFNRVQLALSEYMNTRGFQIYDETSIAGAITPPNRVRRRDAELIEIARAAPTPVDAMAVYQIYASVRRSPAANIRFPEVRIAGRILNVRTGQFISSFEVGGFQLPALPNPCDRECVLENVGSHSRILATDLGSALSSKLEAFARPGGGTAEAGKDTVGGAAAAGTAAANADGCVSLPTDYQVVLRDFKTSDVNKIESGFVRWGCYQQHRTLSMTDNGATFFYRTSVDSARLTRNFRLMMELEGINAQVTFTGNIVTITRVMTR